MPKLQRALIMAGGTGGHVFPGLAIAKALRDRGVEVTWLGTTKGLEAKLVPEHHLPIAFISISGVRGKGIKDLLLAPFRILVAVSQSLRMIRTLAPDVVIGMGGFVSGPGGIAAWLSRTPLIIHEQNAKPGTTNKWLAKVANKVLEGFPNTFPKSSKVVVTGNPVRPEIAALSPQQARAGARLRLLVLGGSLGAAAINQLLPQAIALMPESIRPEVYHQAGEKHADATRLVYQQNNVTANVVPFIKEMDQAYGWADIVVCRAGALTIAELCAAGVGGILIPFPQAVDDHQTANANFMVKGQAALLCPQATLTAESMATLLQQLTESPERCQAMAKAAYALRSGNATEKVLTICEEICH